MKVLHEMLVVIKEKGMMLGGFGNNLTSGRPNMLYGYSNGVP